MICPTLSIFYAIEISVMKLRYFQVTYELTLNISGDINKRARDLKCPTVRLGGSIKLRLQGFLTDPVRFIIMYSTKQTYNHEERVYYKRQRGHIVYDPGDIMRREVRLVYLWHINGGSNIREKSTKNLEKEEDSLSCAAYSYYSDRVSRYDHIYWLVMVIDCVVDKLWNVSRVLVLNGTPAT